MSACSSCGNPLMPGTALCKRCGIYTLTDTGSITSVSKAKTTTLDQVVGTQVIRMKVGEPWDECFGGGIVVTSSTLVGGAPGGGKALSLDTPIPTSSGWTTMKDVRVGDVLFDERGETCRVIGAYGVLRDRPCYAVRFVDGERIVCDADHLWFTMTSRERSYGGGYVPTGIGAVRTTSQIAESVRVGRTRWHPKGQANHSVARAAPLVLPEADLLIAPYTLGVWLGDGSSRDGEFTGRDYEIAERINADGYKTSERVASGPSKKYPNRAPVWAIFGLRGQLIELGLRNNKHIPPIYLRASVAQRLELLRGLMDTDGDCSVRGMCAFNTTSSVLRDGVSELLASLGIKSSWIELESKLKGRVYGKCWRFCFKTTTRVFNLPRKAKRQYAVEGGRTTRRCIESVRCVKSVPVRCIMVDSPSKLYLAGRSMVPTHNTTGLLQVSSNIAKQTGRRSYLISAEQAPGDIKLTVERLKIDPSLFRVLSEFGGGTGADVDESLLKEDLPAAFVIDSVSAMCGKDTHAAIAIARRYKVLADKFKAPAFLICHMTKEHDYAGLMALQHEVDTLLTIFPEDDGRRHLKAWKSRFGPTHAEYFMVMTELGLQPVPKKEKGKKGNLRLVVPDDLEDDRDEDDGDEDDEGGAAPPKPRAKVPRFQDAVDASSEAGPALAPRRIPKPPPLPSSSPAKPMAAERAAAIRVKKAKEAAAKLKAKPRLRPAIETAPSKKVVKPAAKAREKKAREPKKKIEKVKTKAKKKEDRV